MNKELEEEIVKGVESCLNSGKYKDYLRTAAKFYRYSFNNCLLIAMQFPKATQVATFRKWQTDFERHIKAGEKGIMIIVPRPHKKEVKVKNEDGDEETKEVKYTTFGKAYVFDVSQTEGKELPTICEELEGEVKDFLKVKTSLISLSPVPVLFKDTGSEAKGFFSPTKMEIVVSDKMSELQTIKTLIHEIAHARLGHGEKECELKREEKELQAESVAYIVSAALGLDTSSYSFEYLASWAGKAEELRKQMEAIQTCASLLLSEYRKAGEKNA